MAYIGIDPNVGDISFQTFTGTGNAQRLHWRKALSAAKPYGCYR